MCTFTNIYNCRLIKKSQIAIKNKKLDVDRVRGVNVYVKERKYARIF